MANAEHDPIADKPEEHREVKEDGSDSGSDRVSRISETGYDNMSETGK